MRGKITEDHLRRQAYVYVRQSSLQQVRCHQESRRLQYQLVAKAKDLGWSQVEVIDEDQGRSGASTVDRVGFQRLAAEISLGRCGAIFSLDASRLARNNADWYRLLDLCSLTRTLIVDSEAVYEPRLSNDRLLLGLKGTLSEAELSLLRRRAQQGLLSKAARGELYTSLPVGFVLTPNGRLEKDPDRRVQESMQGMFAKFSETGSARQTLLWYRQEGIQLPVKRHSAWGWETVWKLPVYSTVLRLLKNPLYTGAYAWGRTWTETYLKDGQARKRIRSRAHPEQWTVWLKEHHPGYIDWKRFEGNQRLLADNAQMRGKMAKGAVRSGKSLLAGLLLCGHCGRRLHVAYAGVGGRIPRYHCRGGQINHGVAGCISFGGRKVDQAVGREILRVVSPGAIEAALRVEEEATERDRLKRELLERELEQLRYQARRTQRQYDAVDPENRLVAATLERKWNEALKRVRQVQSRLEQIGQERSSSPGPQRVELLRLAERFPALWSDAVTDNRIKKRIARTLIEEIIASVDQGRREVELIIRWRGGKHTRLQVRKNATGRHRYRTEEDVVKLVRQLARQVSDDQIARILNRMGKKTGRGHSWNKTRVRSLRNYRRIPAFSQRPHEFCNMQEAASQLGISPSSVRKLVARKLLPARQVVATAPWQIRHSDLGSEAVQRAAEAIRSGRRVPRGANASQLSLMTSTM